jgi:hypothetical protein
MQRVNHVFCGEKDVPLQNCVKSHKDPRFNGPDSFFASEVARVSGIWLEKHLRSNVSWSLTVVVSVKYASFILLADNHGEGGIISHSLD